MTWQTNKSFWLGCVASFFFWMCVIIAFVWFLSLHSKGPKQSYFSTISVGLYTPDNVRIFYIEDHLSGNPDSKPFEGLVAFDEHFNKIDMMSSTPELTQAAKITLVGDYRMQTIGLTSPTVTEGIAWNSGKKQFQVTDAKKWFKEQLGESPQVVFFGNYRIRKPSKSNP